ncbi:MAG: DUF763 domain-containing protein [bacterium]
MRKGVATLPLHWGTAPRWLFDRMTRMARAVGEIIVAEYGPDELLRRLSDPVWFQAFGCVAGFDWHSSGVTTTVCGAFKEGLSGLERDTGVFVCGGKGRASRRTPDELRVQANAFGLDGESLVRLSRLTAKVDSAGLQDGFQIYHHVFFGTTRGQWAVVQQGMNTESKQARRYHWLGEKAVDPVSDPHEGVACDVRTEPLNMVAGEAVSARQAVAELARLEPESVVRELERVRKLAMPAKHPVGLGDCRPEYLRKVLTTTYETPPADFTELLLSPGVGAKTVRALALVAEVTYGAELSFRDPVTYSFAVGGKDGWPYPVNRGAYDRVLSTLERAIRAAKLGNSEQLGALKRLESWSRETAGQS